MLKDTLVLGVLENPQVIEGRDSGRKFCIEFSILLALGVRDGHAGRIAPSGGGLKGAGVGVG
jgi:hypothetical protein